MSKKRKHTKHKNDSKHVNKLVFLVIDALLFSTLIYGLGLMYAAESDPFINCAIEETVDEKDVCYFKLAETDGDIYGCAMVDNDYRRDVCYVSYVVQYEDYSVCNQILDTDLYESCVALAEAPQ